MKIAIVSDTHNNWANFEKAIKFIFAEFKISSIPIKTRIAFLLDIMAYSPSPKSIALKIKK